MKRAVRAFWMWLIGDWYEVRPCRPPLRPGFAVYNPRRRMVLRSGIKTAEQAQEICDRENARAAGG